MMRGIPRSAPARIALAALLVLLGAAGQGRAAPSFDALDRALTDRVVVPAYRSMAEAMAALDKTTAAFCADPSPDGLASAKRAFARAMGAWQRAQPIGFGPVMKDGRNARIAFWPDRHGTAARQVRRALAVRDPSLVRPGGLAGRSVALQGLPTYERILYGRGQAIAAGASQADRYACALAAGIARFQAGLAAAILAEWTAPGGHREAVMGAAAGNAAYAKSADVATLFLKSLVDSIDRVVRAKLEPPLGKTVEAARPRSAESWRSGLSLANVLDNLGTVRALYETPEGFGDLVRRAAGEALDRNVRDAFVRVFAALEAVRPPLAEAVGDPAARAKLVDAIGGLKLLRYLLSDPVASALGLVLGFNAMDGD